MAKAPAVKPEAQYRVDLKRSIEISPGVVARPIDNPIKLKGRIVSEHLDDIETYEEIAGTAPPAAAPTE